MHPQKTLARLTYVVWLLLPSLAAAQPTAPIAYVANQALNEVEMLSTSDGSALGSIPVGQTPTGIALAATGGFALVANQGSESVSRIDLATSTVPATIPVAGNPTTVAILPDASKAYVVQSTNCPPSATQTPPPCTVAVIDLASNTVSKTITVGRTPFAVAVSPSGGFAYVTNRQDATLSVINTVTDTVVDTVFAGFTPEGLAVGAGLIYVTNDSTNTVTIIREIDHQAIATLPAGASPLSVAIAPSGKIAVVGNDTTDTATIIDVATNTVLSTVPIGGTPAGIAITPDSAVAAVANVSAGSVSFVPLAAGGAPFTVSVSGSPSGVAIPAAPSVAVSQTTTPAVAFAGSSLTYSIAYQNQGNAGTTGVTVTQAVPSGLFFVSATAGGVFTGTDVVWTVGDLAAGASGGLQATYTVDPTLSDSTVLITDTTIADTPGNQAVNEIQVLVRAPGGLGIDSARYLHKGGNRAGDSLRFRAEPILPSGFNNDGMVITWMNDGEVIDTVTIDPGLFVVSRGGDRWRFNGRLPDGSRVAARVESKGAGNWRVTVSHTKVSLPLVIDYDFFVTAVIGQELTASERLLVPRRARAGSLSLVYKS